MPLTLNPLGFAATASYIPKDPKPRLTLQESVHLSLRTPKLQAGALSHRSVDNAFKRSLPAQLFQLEPPAQATSSEPAGMMTCH